MVDFRQKQKEKNIDEMKKVLKLALSDYNNTTLWFTWIEAHEEDSLEIRRQVKSGISSMAAVEF